MIYVLIAHNNYVHNSSNHVDLLEKKMYRPILFPSLLPLKRLYIQTLIRYLNINIRVITTFGNDFIRCNQNVIKILLHDKNKKKKKN